MKGEVELSDEREIHIAYSHPDLLPEYLVQVGQTLAAPDQVRRSLRMSSARIFCRRFEEARHSATMPLREGKYVVVVVVSESMPVLRHWIITAYMTRRLANGEVEWRKI
ncbi:MAG: hypothetical protein NT118_01470 [Lentisphaerae bacterium]|nr:hypothetical protein [Lentisphaerota bacterium]